MTLLEWQNVFSAQLRGKSENESNHLARLSVYRDSINAIHQTALKISFPVIEKLLGRRIFAYLSNDFIKETDWQSYSLDEFGDDFPGFINNHKQLNSLLYMAEVAAIEWTVQSLPENIRMNEDLEQRLFSMAKSGQDIQIQLKSNVMLVYSEHGGIEIWRAHQNEVVEEIDLQQTNPCYCYLIRTHDGLSVDVISRDLYRFGKSLQGGISMTRLCERIGIDLAIRQLKSLMEHQLISFHPI